jgi:hypothetical protein
MTVKRRVIVDNAPVRVVTVVESASPRVISVNPGRVIVATVADTQRRVVINDTAQRQSIVTTPAPRRVIVSTPQVRVISIGIQGPQGAGGSGGSGLVYSVQDGPDYQTSYVYVGYKEPAGAWYIYRRTYAGNVREYSSGALDYTNAWTDRTAQIYT